MAIRVKRLLALFLATALVVTAIPENTLLATGVEDAQEVTEGTDEAGESEEEADNGSTVLEDGEVVQEGAVGKVDQSEWITIDDYEKIAESDSYIMYLYEPRLSIILKDKKTGELLESTLSDEMDDGNSNESWNAYMKSGIVITAIKGTTNTYQVDLITCKNTRNVTKLDNGFSADITFEDWGFSLTLQVTLEGDDLVVTVPDESIQETEENCYISTISLYPFMGYSFLDDKNGYMLVPDGNGALIYLDNKEGRYTTGFSQMIYGKDAGFEQPSTQSYLWEKYDTVIDANQVIAPVFGMAHTDEQLGYVAVVEDGDTRASIEAHPNGVMVNYNRCFAKFMLRDIYVQPLNQSNSGTVTNVEADRTHTDYTVRYMLLDGEDANYSGMAVRYRSYLLDNGLVQVKDTSYNTRVDFLGTEREEFLLGTTAVTMTTTDNIEEMYDELQEAGVDSVLSVYKGWQKGGLYNVPITKYKADRKIGGTGALTDLIEESAKENYNIYLYNDALKINARTNTTTFNAVKMVNKRTLKEEEYAEVYKTFYYLMPGKADATLDKFVSSYTKQGVSNLVLAGITNSDYSYSQRGSYYGRQNTADAYQAMIADVDESTNLVLEQPFAYLWNNTDAFLDMPLGSSDYMYVNEEVPFLSMVLKGILPMYSDYVNFEANKTEFFLQMVESGVYPSFYLTYENSSKLIYTNSSDLYSTEYGTYKDTVIAYDEALREVAASVEGAYITKHEKLDNGVTRVSYDNGVVIYVNYSENNVTVDGYSIDAMSYKVGEAQ
ncbi:MAG: DUF5696 domain-containing protein [Lachnospiraceae bacterium]|nr:DUF5696 domain-containing protein [Lachnospiraceae bacterium]